MNTDSFKNRYEIIKKIGAGSFGEVYLAISKKNTIRKVAVKVIPIKSSNKNVIIQEVVSMYLLSEPKCNPYVACYYDSFIDKSKGIIVIEMEYINGPNVKIYTQPLRDTNNLNLLNLTGRKLLKSMLKGLKYIHSKHILHNDIKPSNIVVSKDRIPILVDLGISCFTEAAINKLCKNSGSECCKLTAGTSLYLPPEVLQDVRYPASDLWSLAATIYMVITGNNIWSINMKQSNIKLLTQVVKKIRLKILPNKLYTKDIKLNTIINSFLNYKISERMSIDEALKLLS